MTGLIGTTLQPGPLTGQLSDEHRGEDPSEPGVNASDGRVEARGSVFPECDDHPGVARQLVEFSDGPPLDSGAVVGQRRAPQRLTKPDRKSVV